MLAELRGLADSFAQVSPSSSPGAFSVLYRDTVAMIDTALRTVSLLPDSATSQMHLCRGLEVTLEEVADRLRTLTAGHQRWRSREEQIACLAGLLSTIDAGQPLEIDILQGLAEQILAEARDCEPLVFLEGDPHDVPRFVACHSLTVARVLARIIRHDSELRSHALEAVMAALVHDVGMLGVSAEVLAHTDLIASEQRRLVEATRSSALSSSLRCSLITRGWARPPPGITNASTVRVILTGSRETTSGRWLGYSRSATFTRPCVSPARIGQAGPRGPLWPIHCSSLSRASSTTTSRSAYWRCRSTRLARWSNWPTERSEWSSPRQVRELI